MFGDFEWMIQKNGANLISGEFLMILLSNTTGSDLFGVSLLSNYIHLSFGGGNHDVYAHLVLSDELDLSHPH